MVHTRRTRRSPRARETECEGFASFSSGGPCLPFHLNLVCLHPLVSLNSFEADPLPLLQRLEAGALDRPEMNEKVRSGLRRDEAVPLLVTEPLHCAGLALSHVSSPSVVIGCHQRTPKIMAWDRLGKTQKRPETPNFANPDPGTLRLRAPRRPVHPRVGLPLPVPRRTRAR